MKHIIYIHIKKEVNVKMTEKAHLSVRIPKELMKDLKIIAIEKETNVTEIVIPLLVKYVQENKK